jgi:hypothetical protein
MSIGSPKTLKRVMREPYWAEKDSQILSGFDIYASLPS